MTQRAFGARIRSNLASGPTMGMPTASQNWVTFHACHLVPPMQPALVGYERCQLRSAFSFLTQPVDPKLLAHARITRAIMRVSFHNFLRPYEFLMVFSVKRNENTDRRVTQPVFGA